MIEAIVEANVEKQSFPNLYMKFPFKERSEELQKGHFILGKKGIFFLIIISVPQQVFYNGTPRI